MKKILFLMSLAVAVLACNKEIPAGPQPAQEHITLDFTIDDDGSPETRAVKTGWVNNDRMYVFFDDISETAEYLIIKYSSSTKKWNPETWTPGLESKLYHHLPFLGLQKQEEVQVYYG